MPDEPKKQGSDESNEDNVDSDHEGGKEEAAVVNVSGELRTTPDWGPNAVVGDHLWVVTSSSGDICHVNDCSKHGERIKCSACRLCVHRQCLTELKMNCKNSYQDTGLRSYREKKTTNHHWVHRRSQKGKCPSCSKAFQSKLSFTSKETVAVICSWCKTAYHNKNSCFTTDKVGEICHLGTHKSIIVPPSWIIKIPKKENFKSSLRKSPKKIKSSTGIGGGSGDGPSTSSSTSLNCKKNKNKNNQDNKTVVVDDNDNNKTEIDYNKLWIIKPIPTLNIHPLLVFINPKSGGNQGSKLLQKFQWFLNPRQVFDLTKGGPKMGLDLFKKVSNLRVLACGGDGTVGWVLSVIDQIGINPSPAVGTLPLGTGNDLARALGWGGGYTDEPISKILINVNDSNIKLLDRWSLTVTNNPDGKNDDTTGRVKDKLPLNVVNNYFSLGVDAHIALEFHEAREANPEKFNSRLKNKFFYGQAGGKDLLQRKWKDLTDFVKLECDGKDLTPKLIEHRVHSIVFLNIASYGGGTHPWTSMPGSKEPSTDDGLFEVVGLTTYQLPLLQAGGHGTPLAQCSRAVLSTTKTIPMQVDGEACRMLPSIIEMKHLNKATMLAKRRSRKSHQIIGDKLDNLTLPLMKIKMKDYEQFYSDKKRLIDTAVRWTNEPLELDATTDLESLRKLLSKDYKIEYFCFLDSCTAERFFRIDFAQEHLHYVTDVASEAIYILEDDTIDIDTTINQSIDDKNIISDCKLTSGDKQTNVILKKQDTSPNNKNQKTPIKDKRLSDDKYQIKSSTLSPQQTTSTSASSTSPSSTKYLSSAERLFSLTGNINSSLLEKTNEGILRCAKNGDLKGIKEYYERGFSLMAIDSNGQTALHISAKYGHKDIVKYLIACAPQSMINMIDNDSGQTALHKAAQQRNSSICCMLVAAGSTLNVRDKNGKTPKDIAVDIDDKILITYLQNQEEFQNLSKRMEHLP